MTHKENTPIFELLAPAGSPAILEAVIQAGADAVYLGGNRYGARAYAENFSQEQLLRALDYAHIRGRKIYLTVNTLLKNNEIDGLCDYIAPLYERGLDAVLVQDFGVLHLLKENFPDLLIHASTQMTLVGADGVRFLQEQGVQRVVLSRELSLAEVARIHEETGMELEVFVHGALCYCYSGQCLFSSMLGGRSGNRGRCAQPCRLPYTVSDEKGDRKLQDVYILSMKDNCGIEDLAALHQAGVYSLKIEGRMKQEAYAVGVVAYYRKYIDCFTAKLSEDEDEIQQSHDIYITPEDAQTIADLGNRCGFTDGYYRKRNGSDMITYDKPNYTTKAQTLSQSSSGDFTDKVHILGHAVFHQGIPSELSVWLSEDNTCILDAKNNCGQDDERKQKPFLITVTGQTPDKAQKVPVTAEELRQRLMKTGDTAFVFSELTVDADEELFVPNGAVNRLRRDALEALEKAMLDPYRKVFIKKENKSENMFYMSEGQENDGTNESLRLAALISNLEQLAAVLADGRVTTLYLETITYPRAELLAELSNCFRMIENTGREYTVYLALPPVFRQHTRDFYTSIVQEIPASRNPLPDIERSKVEPKMSIMSASEKNACSHAFGERRMLIMNEVHDIIRGFLVRNYEEFAWVGEYFPNAERIIDHHLYTYNDVSVSAFFMAGADRNTVPLELNRAEIFKRDNRRSEMVIYGRYPLMLSAQCVYSNSIRNSKNQSGCDGRSAVTTLTDRRGVQFPVCNFCSECLNIIYNSVPTMLFGRMRELEQNGIKSFRLEFTVESQKEVSNILAVLPWKNWRCASGTKTTAGKQLKDSAAHTNGHYTRGVE